MFKKMILIMCLISSSYVSADDELSTKDLMLSSKVSGVCDTLIDLVKFRNNYKDSMEVKEFMTSFIKNKLIYLDMSLDEFTEVCRNATAIYDYYTE